MKAKNDAGVDLFRIPAALMVAAIHIAPFSTWNRVGDVLFTYCLGRIAVPFFLMTTGFFVLAPYAKSGFRDKRRLVRFLRQNTPVSYTHLMPDLGFRSVFQPIVSP